ncbi:hypothetical protein Mal64_38180 [Pseudobythopirellula maris]|uniref:Uncharacterized protein n=1 Tax=Pseudobythopirellula maris TaxID=2527991 RepID=A0A5C5ZGK2_9BACT|nr:MafI family immunity protein [Pseudobythopirellula maris]TWT86278.1 hypothetical protein Mal64_38180 [Pseudobythopirellula maris]
MWFKPAIETELSELLSDLMPLLGQRDFDIAFEFLDHREWGLALDHACCQLYENDTKILQSQYDRIVKTGRRMRLPESEFQSLKQLIAST